MANEQRSPFDSAKPRLLYVVTEDWAFLSHRLPMARAAREAGFEVHVATRVSNGAAAIEAERFVLHPIPFARGSLSPVATLLTIAALRRVHRNIKPVLTHHVALQACVLGMLASFGQSCACLNAFIGLGYSFTSESGKARVVRKLVGSLLRFFINRNHCIALVQNPDDMAALLSLGIAKKQIALIAGSGVDIDRFTPMPEPGGAPTLGFVGRLLDDKGIRTLVAAHQLLRTRVPKAQLLIAGTPDPANPASVTEGEARSWNELPGITWLGQVNDIADFWARIHVAVLPSRREGLPKSLLEAAACGRSLIASDVPGCREIARHGVNALLVPPDDPEALAHAIATLMNDRDMRIRFGRASRQIVVAEFSNARVGNEIVALYTRLLTQTA